MNQRGQSLTIDLGWHQSDEGLSALAHLRDPISGNPKRIFGNLSFSDILLCIYLFFL